MDMKKSKWLVMAGLLALILAAPHLITNTYYLHVINLSAIYSLIIIGLNLLSGYTGQTSMGQAGFFAIGTYVAALLMMNLKLPFLLAGGVAILTAAVFGLIISIPTMKLSGPYLVLATVGFGEIIRLVLLNWTPVTRGAAGLVGIPYPEFFGLKIVSERQFFYLIITFLAMGTFIALRLAKSKIGRTLSAIREDEIAASAMGVPVNHYKVAAFVISAMFAGLAGVLFGSFSGVTSPDSFTFDESVAFLSMSVIGGNKTIAGGILGAFVLTILSEMLRAFQGIRLIIYGLILILTVIFMPNGLIGVWRQLVNKRQQNS